jgi:hypothetical protein
VRRTARTLALTILLGACSGSVVRAPKWSPRVLGAEPDAIFVVDVAGMREDEVYGPVVEHIFAREPGPGRAVARARSLEMTARFSAGKIGAWVAVVGGIDPEGAKELTRPVEIRFLGEYALLGEGTALPLTSISRDDLRPPTLPSGALLGASLRGGAIARPAHGHPQLAWLRDYQVTDVEQMVGLLYGPPRRRFAVHVTFKTPEASDGGEIAVLRARRDLFDHGRPFEGLAEISVARSGRELDVELSLTPRAADYLLKRLGR